jgi:hypothetical protein
MDSRVDATGQSTVADDATALAHGSGSPAERFGRGSTPEEPVLSPIAIDRQLVVDHVAAGHVRRPYWCGAADCSAFSFHHLRPPAPKRIPGSGGSRCLTADPVKDAQGLVIGRSRRSLIGRFGDSKCLCDRLLERCSLLMVVILVVF